MQKSRFNFTEPAIRNLRDPGYYWDTQVSAFGIAIGRKAKTFIVVQNGGRRIKLGRFPDELSIQDARKKARRILYADSPNAPVEAAPPILTLLTQFLDHQALITRPRTVHEYRRLLNAHFAPRMRAKTLERVTAADVLSITDSLLQTPAEAIHAHAAIKRFFNWTVERRIIPMSPVASLPLPAKPAERERVLSDDELKRVYAAAQDMAHPFGYIVLVAIHTLMRRSEVAALKWSYITPEYITLPPELTKNGRPHSIPNLIGANLALIPQTSEYLFPSAAETPFSAWSKNKIKLDAKAEVTDWVLHDLRRTGRSRLAEWECCSPDIAERLLGHTTAQTRLERIYNRWSHLPQMRAALEKYEARLGALIATH